MPNNDKPFTKVWVQAILAFGFGFGTIAYMFVFRQMPEALMTITGMIIAFYFGQQAGKEKPES